MYENVIIFNRMFPEQSLTALFINGIFRIDCANVRYWNGIYKYVSTMSNYIIFKCSVKLYLLYICWY